MKTDSKVQTQAGGALKLSIIAMDMSFFNYKTKEIRTKPCSNPNHKVFHQK